MMTKFYDNTIITKFIKYIISHFNLPIVPFWTPNTFVKQGGLYIYNGYLYKALESGTPLDINGKIYDNIENKYINKKFFDMIQPFVFGNEYKNMTTRYIGTSSGYDPQTHYYLGECLRTIKAYYDIDLMSLYNCFNGVYVDDVDFDGKVNTGEKGGQVQYPTQDSPLSDFGVYNKTPSQTHKILSVPIKFGKSYHIAIDSDLPISVVPVIYDTSGLNEQYTKSLLMTRGDKGKQIGKYQKFQSAHFQRMDIEIPKMDYADESSSQTGYQTQELGQYERFLRLLIKVPRSNTSSVVVLEDGDIKFLDRNVSVVKQYAVEKGGVETNLLTHTTNSIMIGDSALVGSTPKLTFFNDGNNYAFSDTLLQYLLLNVISNMDDIDDDIVRIQDYITSTTFRNNNNGKYYRGFMHNGVWDDGMKNFIFQTVMSSVYLPTKLDKFGYVDSETESIIMRGQVV